MTEVQKLEIELEANEVMVDFLQEQLIKYQREGILLTGRLNRARRLEREELQNGKQ